MSNFKIIAISGVGRAGKDTFFRFASEYLNSLGVTTERFAFADELKSDMDSFIRDKFGFSAFTEKTEEKNKIRPLLVEYGKIRRAESRGQHWLNQIKPRLLSPDGAQVRFITDLRFAKFGEGDELDFVKSNGGKVIHVQRYVLQDWLGYDHLVEPANSEESTNDPLIWAAADIKLKWYSYEDFKQPESVARKQVEDIFEKNRDLWEVAA